MSKSSHHKLLFCTSITSAWTLAKASASLILLPRKLILSLQSPELVMNRVSECSCQEPVIGRPTSSTTLLLASGSKVRLSTASCASLSCSRRSLSLQPALASAHVCHSWRVAPNTPCMCSGWAPTLEHPSVTLSSTRSTQQTPAHASSIPQRQAGVTSSDWPTPDMLSLNQKQLSSFPTPMSPDWLLAALSAVAFLFLVPSSTPEEKWIHR
jgi:hypothetical protein